jgi:glyoxylase-like metal-dependent hydrolase (beta-lactamase superfamily II)
VVSLIKATTTVTTGADVATMLNESSLGIRADDVEAIIWSHNHFDHVGDPATTWAFSGRPRIYHCPKTRPFPATNRLRVTSK